MTIFIHIGSHKTSTTAIQAFAARNRAWLKKQGLIYSSFDLVGEKPTQSHWELINHLGNKTAPPAKRTRALNVLAAAREASEASGKNVLFSAESMFRLNSEQHDRVCTAFRDTFAGLRVVVVATLRDPVDFADSLYRNIYRVYAKRPPDFGKWLAQRAELFDYEGTIENYKRGFGTTEDLLLGYHSASRSTFVPDFFTALGTDVSAAPHSVGTVNSSLDTVDCLAKATVMTGGPDKARSEAFNTFAQRRKLSTNYSFLGPSESRRLRNRQAEGNTRLIQRAPQLEPALAPDRPIPARHEIDTMANGLAQVRAETFLQQ